MGRALPGAGAAVTARRLLAVAVAGLLAAALAGCSLIEGAIEQQTGTDIELGGASVPADFPSDVPLVEGAIVNGSSGTGPGGEQVWNILINATAADAPAQVAALLEGAGFMSPTATEAPTEGTANLTYVRTDLVVNVVLAKIGEGWTADYTVARTGA